MIKDRGLKKGLLLSFFLATTVLLSSGITTYASNKKYFLKTNVDFAGFGLLYDVVTDNAVGDNESSPYEEQKDGYVYSALKHYGKIGEGSSSTVGTDGNYLKINFLKDINADLTSENSNIEKVLENRYGELKNGSLNAPLVFTFPGIKDDMILATSNDYIRAQTVGETLVSGLNQAIVFINNNTHTKLVSNNSLKYLLAKLSYTSELGPSGMGSYSFLVGDSGKSNTITVTRILSEANVTVNGRVELIPVKGLNYNDYVKITVKNGVNGTVYSYFPWKMEKGYSENQELFENFNRTIQNKIINKTDGDAYEENSHLTWGQLILQAMVNNDVFGATEQDYAGDIQTVIGQGLGSDLTRTISSVRSLLGLSSMSELVLNMGARPKNYHMGVMTNDMHTIAMTVYTINLILSLSFVGFMIIKMIHQKMLATTNVVAKTNLMEGIKDLAFVAVMLGFFAPLFEVLLEFNFLIVRTFSYSSEYMKAFSTLGTTALSMESMAGFIVSSMFLSIDMYINFVYLVREITVSFLFAVAPIIIVSYLWSPNQKNMVFGFFRELVGNIFMQSFHAITMTFFSAYNMTNMSSLQALASAYCFIPITQLFRQLILGNSGGFSERIGGKLAGQVSNMTMGMQKASLQAKQSKELFNAQTKATLDTQKGQTYANMAQTGISGVGKVVGGLAENIPFAGKAVSGLVQGGADMLGTGLAGKIAYDATKNAQTELGKTVGLHADQTLGMGLAEMGVGLGVSSFDGVGNSMIGDGIRTVQEGARMKGKSEALLGEAGDNLAGVSKWQAYNNGVSMVGRTLDSYISSEQKEKERKVSMQERDDAKIAKSHNEFEANTVAISRIPGLTGISDNRIISYTQGEGKNDIYAHTDINFTQIDSYKNRDYNSFTAQAGKYNNIGSESDSNMEKLLMAYAHKDTNSQAKMDYEMIQAQTGITDILKGQLGELSLSISGKTSGMKLLEGYNVNNGVIDRDKLRYNPNQVFLK